MRLRIAFLIDSVEFTPSVIDGSSSLGGSESACLGLARALVARGHTVHICATKLSPDAPSVDAHGVLWHPMSDATRIGVVTDVDVAVALRMPALLQTMPNAKLRVLWNQDLMADVRMKNLVMSMAWAFDRAVYVSEYHRKQWEGVVPELAPIGWVTRNGYEPSYVPSTVTKQANRVIHISRPERGLEPILQMWPAIKAARPDAELHLCRYSSMYDATGWGKVCSMFDAEVAKVQAAVGGIVWLGELGKAELYEAIASSAVMWYPGVSTFAETSCIAAIEAQACGTPFVGSYKGALPETVPSGVLVKGVAEADAAYHAASVAAVVAMLDGCQAQTTAYQAAVDAGRRHVTTYTHAAVAASWETWLWDVFHERYREHKPAVLRRLVHEDDYVMASVVARELMAEGRSVDLAKETIETGAAIAAGRLHTAEDYAIHALDPVVEVQAKNGRQEAVVERLHGRRNVLDIACGNGAFAIALALADPKRRVTGIDYSLGNIEAAQKAAVHFGVADRVTFTHGSVWDFETQTQTPLASSLRGFDGVFVGEFLEHVTATQSLVSAVNMMGIEGAIIVWTCPAGPFRELAERGSRDQQSHVHHFRAADIASVFCDQAAVTIDYLPMQGRTLRGSRVGHWCVSYQVSQAEAGERDLMRCVLTRPYQSVSVGMIVDNVLDLRRCLNEVWPVADEILLGDCGAGDALLPLLAEFPRKTRIVPVGRVTDLRQGFSEARNTVLAEAQGEWFLWIDADERLVGGAELAKYLEGPTYNGFSIDQRHLQLDTPNGCDRPVRVFRHRADIRFYGCVHEQPQMGDCNGDIVPALHVENVMLAHTGYLHESVRRKKALMRNLPLLVRDRVEFPDRELGHLLVLRDFANLALWDAERHGGKLSEQGRYYAGNVIGIFEQRYMDPGHKYHALARPFYESALQHGVAGAMEVEMGFALRVSGLQGQRAMPQRIWVRTPDHLRSLVTHHINDIVAGLTPTSVLDLEPINTEVHDELCAK